MTSSFRCRTDGIFKSFKDWKTIWHKSFQRRNPKWRELEMYTNGQFDEEPYIVWEEDELIDEFDYYEELVEYDNSQKPPT